MNFEWFNWLKIKRIKRLTLDRRMFANQHSDFAEIDNFRPVEV